MHRMNYLDVKKSSLKVFFGWRGAGTDFA